MNFDGRQISSSLPHTRTILAPGLVKSCLDFFFNNLHHFNPVLSWEKAQEAIESMERVPESYCLIVALCAYVMTQPSFEIGQVSNISVHALLAESEQLHKDNRFRKNPTYMTELISWFHCSSYSTLWSENAAWFYYTQQLLGTNDEYATHNIIPPGSNTSICSPDMIPNPKPHLSESNCVGDHHLLPTPVHPQSSTSVVSQQTVGDRKPLSLSPEAQGNLLGMPRRKHVCWDHECNGRQFSSSTHLRRHQREKSDTQKESCPTCQRTFTRRATAKKHKERGNCKSTTRGTQDYSKWRHYRV